MQYRYILDKSPKKYICPKCNKKTFVRIVDIQTGDLAADNFGRCDREMNCGYFELPKADGSTLTNITGFIQPEIKEPTFHNPELVSNAGREFKNNNFVQFLKTLFTDAEVKTAIQTYLIGTSKKWNGANVFWQIDGHERVRAGKIMQYNPTTGKRAKREDGTPLITWVHSELKLKPFNLSQCLFGLHTVNEVGSKEVAIVESEKTAIIMSLFLPEYAWVATGAKNGFKRDILKDVKNKKIIGFPDKGCFDEWNKTANDLNKVGFNIKVSSLLETRTDLMQGDDLADLYIAAKSKQKEKPGTPVLIDLSKYNDVEVQVSRIEKENPAIRTLITAFDLTDNYGRNIRSVV